MLLITGNIQVENLDADDGGADLWFENMKCPFYFEISAILLEVAFSKLKYIFHFKLTLN